VTILQFLNQIGFVSHPFYSLNADQEAIQLEEYFVTPDYFEDLWGDPFLPFSNIIYAPRGGGKSAQRIMLEKRAEIEKDVLPISYINHDLSKFSSIDNVNINYHLFALNQLLLASFFKKVAKTDEEVKNQFKYKDRQFLFKLAKQYLYNNPSYPSSEVKSLKKFNDTLMDFWRVARSPITNIIRGLSKKQGLEIDLSITPYANQLESTHKENLNKLIEYCVKSGFVSIYVFVDKVDEQSLTGNDASASFKLIKDLLLNLTIIELPNLCFKFFLWDALKEFTYIHGRPDRVKVFDISWTKENIHDILNKRISTYSENKFSTIQDVLEKKNSINKILLFSEYSPRDAIRICSKIMSEQHKSNPSSNVFEDRIVDIAIMNFAKEKSDELVKLYKNSNFIQKINAVDFTVTELINSKLTQSEDQIKDTLQELVKSSLLMKIENNLEKEEYAFLDIRLAFDACSNMNIDDFINKKVYKCHAINCSHTYYRDFDKTKFRCPKCNTENL